MLNIFAFCTKISSIEIPKYVSYIGDKILQECDNLQEIRSKIENPSNCNVLQFSFDWIPNSCILYVPKGTKSAYEESVNWVTYFSGRIIEDISQFELTLSSSLHGKILYNGTVIRDESKTFTLSEGTSVTITFAPDANYRVASVKLNGTDVTSSVSNNQYTITNISSNTTLEVTFEAITHTLSITASGSGSASYNSTSIRGKTESFTVNEGSSATITFTPDAGYRIASVKLNGTDVTANVTDNKYMISNITADVTLFVTFEAITHTLSITSSGNGSAYYNNTTVRNKTEVFTINEGTSATITLNPDTGYRIKSVKLNNTDVTSSVANSQYIIGNIKSDNTLAVEFEAIPPTTYTLSITASGNGTATYNSTAVRGKTQTFTVTEGTSATIKFTPDTGYRIKSVKMNGTDVTSSVANNQHTISNINSDNTLAVEFEAIPPTTYTLSITASGNGTATYNSTAVRGKTQTFTVTEGTSATIKFTPDTGYRIKSVKLNNTDVTSSVANSQYTISNIKGNNTLAVEFEAIPPTTYTLSITATGKGSATYNSTIVKGKTQTFTVTEGTSATVTFTPDTGYRIKSVKLNNTDVTSSVANSQYIISNIKSDNTLAVEFEAIPPSTYMLNIVAVGNGSVTYNNTTIRNQSKDFTVVEKSAVTITMSPDNGYRIANVKVNSADVTSQVSDGQITISNIMQDTNVEVTFEEIPPTTYSLTITATGNGTVTYDGNNVRGGSSTFTVVEGSYATVQIEADNGYRLKQVTLDGKDVTNDVTDGKYTTAKIMANTTLEVEFVEAVTELAYNGVSYRVVSYDEQTVNVASGNYGLTLTVPATFEANGKTWTVVGIDSDALANATELAAIIWQPEVAFTAKVNNPNLLLYVTQNQYAPSDIQNVVVGDQAENIVLKEAESGNNFYCPKAFTAKRISYEHHYSMTTGYNTCQGWETIALPFDVTTILNQKGIELVPYTTWQQGSNLRPFWLYQLTESGWQAGNGIKANVPYIISMPNNVLYQSSYNQSGYIQFKGNNVEVKASSQLDEGQYGKRHFFVNYQQQGDIFDIYALNVNNQWSSNTDVSQAEGSAFIRNSRAVHPFEAYMTLEGNSAPWMIPVFDNATDVRWLMEDVRGVMSDDAWYDLQGRRLQGEPTKQGIYIYKGKKVRK